jgi:hypothetical protein
MLLVLVAAATAFSNSLRPPQRCTIAHASFCSITSATSVGFAQPKPLRTSEDRTSFRTHPSTITMMGGDRASWYALLGVSPGASPAELKAAYRERAKKCHPDVNPTPAAAQEFQDLTEVRGECSPCL